MTPLLHWPLATSDKENFLVQGIAQRIESWLDYPEAKARNLLGTYFFLFLFFYSFGDDLTGAEIRDGMVFNSIVMQDEKTHRHGGTTIIL